MKSIDYRNLIAALAEIHEPSIDEEIRPRDLAGEPAELTLRFGIEYGDDEGEGELRDISRALAQFGVDEADWTGCGGGCAMDATATVIIDDATYEPCGFGLEKLKLAAD